MNCKERFKDPVFWINNGLAVIIPVFSYYGLKREDFTTWGSVIDIIIQAIKNPYVSMMVFISLWNNIYIPYNKCNKRLGGEDV